MIAHPETQARAQAELDTVVGRARLPTFADYPHLPYIRAMVKEVLRLRPIAPLGLPHRCTEDDWYEGMFIPKGAICIPNIWYMNRDPEVYGENAARFDPDATWTPMGASHPAAHPTPRKRDTSRTVLVVGSVWVVMWPTTHFSSTLRSRSGQLGLSARKMCQGISFRWMWMAS